MGCAGSSPADQNNSGGYDEEGNPALDGPPDFGVDEHYEVRKLLGEGGSGQTWLCLDRTASKNVAIKFIRRPIPKVMLPMLMHEIKIQAELGDGHVNLVSAKAVLLTDTHLGIVMEYAAGGNLTEYVTGKWESSEERDGFFCSEDEARYFFRQYMDAVEFLHANRVAHRDLKLDNVVLDAHNPPRIKVCDFGFAKNWDTESNMYTQIGTPVYMSPQLISAKNSKTGYDAIKADVWACGVLLFVMLHGMFPYDHPENPDPNSSNAHVEVWMQQIKLGWRDCPGVGEIVPKMSAECLDLLDKLFDRNEARRISIQGIKKHRWYRKQLPPELDETLEELLDVQERIAERSQAEARNEAFAKERDRQLEELIEAAGTEASLEDSKVKLVKLARPLPPSKTVRRRSQRFDADQVEIQADAAGATADGNGTGGDAAGAADGDAAAAVLPPTPSAGNGDATAGTSTGDAAGTSAPATNGAGDGGEGEGAAAMSASEPAPLDGAAAATATVRGPAAAAQASAASGAAPDSNGKHASDGADGAVVDASPTVVSPEAVVLNEAGLSKEAAAATAAS